MLVGRGRGSFELGLPPMREIETVLNSATRAGARNALTIGDLRRWLVEYLQEYAAEGARFPEYAGDDHWDMLVADHDTNEDAMFAAAVFEGERVTVVAGRGEYGAVRDFARHHVPAEPRTLLGDLTSRFSTDPPAVVELPDLLRWLSDAF